MSAKASQRTRRRGTHELVGLLDDNHTVAVVAQPHGGVGTGGTATNDDNIARYGLAATTALDGGSCNRGYEAAEAHAGAHDVMHIYPENATRSCSVSGM